MPRRRRRRANWPYRLAWCVIVASVVLYIAVGTLIGGLTYGHRSYGTDWWIAFVTTAMSATIATWFVAVGASLGSFLNVVAYRLPLGRTVGGHSGCPYCCSAIQRGDNVPVLAWIKLRGRCRNCRLPISAQYPLVEFLVAMIFLFVFFSESGSWRCKPAKRPHSLRLSNLSALSDSNSRDAIDQLCSHHVRIGGCGLDRCKASGGPTKAIRLVVATASRCVR